MPIPLDVSFARTFSGTPKRIYQLLAEMGTSGDAIWPFASQPFMRSPGRSRPGQTEEWHLGLHAILESAEPEKSIVWRIDNDGVDGTHGFSIVQDGKKTTVTHRILAQLSDTDGRLFGSDSKTATSVRSTASSTRWPASSNLTVAASAGLTWLGRDARAAPVSPRPVSSPGSTRGRPRCRRHLYRADSPPNTTAFRRAGCGSRRAVPLSGIGCGARCGCRCPSCLARRCRAFVAAVFHEVRLAAHGIAGCEWVPACFCADAAPP